MKASSYQTKKSAKNQIYRAVSPLTSCKYSDECWKGVSDIIAVLKSEGCEVDTRVENGGYRQNSSGTMWKEYLMDIQCGSYQFTAVLNCHAAGSVNDPFDRYDMTFVMN